MADQPVLTTARLRLRPFTLADAPELQPLVGARDVADTTLNIPHPYPPGAADAWIATHASTWAAGQGLTYAMTALESGRLLGAISLALTPAHASGELGYWVAVPEWGRGYATEAASAVCALGFSTLGLHRIQAHHLVRNPASGRVMQKLGMRPEGTLRDAVRKWDRMEDVALHAILATEWSARGASGASAESGASGQAVRSPSTPPVACTLSADVRTCCADELLPGLADAALAVHPMPDGVRLEFAAEAGLIGRVAAVIERERMCCQFLRFELEVAPALGRITLVMSGPPGTGAFLAGLHAAFASPAT